MNSSNEHDKLSRPPAELPPELAAVADGLDALGERERACAPASLEGRIAALGVGRSRASADRGPALVFIPSARLRAAAAVALLAAGAALTAWLIRPGPGVAPVGGPSEAAAALAAMDEEVDAWLDVGAGFALDDFAEMDERLAALDETIDVFWPALDDALWAEESL